MARRKENKNNRKTPVEAVKHKTSAYFSISDSALCKAVKHIERMHRNRKI